MGWEGKESEGGERVEKERGWKGREKERGKGEEGG